MEKQKEKKRVKNSECLTLGCMAAIHDPSDLR
jgi:hypothetical protein